MHLLDDVSVEILHRPRTGPTLDDLEASAAGTHPGIGYGLHGLPTVTDLQSAVAELEGDVGVATGVLQALKTTSRVPPTAAITNAR